MTSGGLAAVSSSAFAALYSAFGKYDVVHIHAEGPAFFAWLPKMFGKRVVVTVHGIDWQREKWQSGLGSKFIHQGEKNAAKYADEVIVLSKGVQDYSAFYVKTPFNELNLGANATPDFVYYNQLRAWKGADDSFPFVDAHAKTYNVRDERQPKRKIGSCALPWNSRYELRTVMPPL